MGREYDFSAHISSLSTDPIFDTIPEPDAKGKVNNSTTHDIYFHQRYVVKKRQPDSMATVLNKVWSICTPYADYTSFAFGLTGAARKPSSPVKSNFLSTLQIFSKYQASILPL